MQVVLLQIFLWILRIILFLLLFIIALVAIVIIVPIRYRVEGELHEKKPGLRGKITWFLYLINIIFSYDNEFHLIVRVFGFKVYDSLRKNKRIKKKKTEVTKLDDNNTGSEITKVDIKDSGDDNKDSDSNINCSNEQNYQKVNMNPDEELDAWEKEVQAEQLEEAKLADEVIQKHKKLSKKLERKKNPGSTDNSHNKKKTFEEKFEDIKGKLQDIVEKVKNIVKKIQDGKLKVEHYLELWNRKETQITFQRAKKKLGKVVKAILPRRWVINGNVGFEDPSVTGKIMGIIGAMYPVFENRVRIIPDFEKEVLEFDGNAKGHIRLGNLIYQLVSLLLNKYCFKFIKLVFKELGGSKKKNKEI